MKILTDTTKADTLENDVTVTPAVAAVAAAGNVAAIPAVPAITTINKYGWYAKAIAYDQIYREARAAQKEDHGGNSKFDKFRQNVQKGKECSWRNPTSTPTRYRDPNAMDVNAMELNVNAISEAKKAYLMKKGACFKCEVQGHMAREHDEYVRNLKSSTGFSKPSTGFTKAPTGYSQKKPDVKEVAKFIRAMNQDERDALFDDFGDGEDLGNKAKDF